jgi:hypothetical protein
LHNNEGAFTFNHAPGERDRLPLAPGEYFATIKIASGETTVDEVGYSFTIGQSRDGTTWASRKIN